MKLWAVPPPSEHPLDLLEWTAQEFDRAMAEKGLVARGMSRAEFEADLARRGLTTYNVMARIIGRPRM